MLAELSLVFVLLAAAYGWVLWKLRHQVREAEKLPCLIPRYPIIGNIGFSLGSLEKVARVVVKIWTEAAAKGVGTTCVWIGPLPLFILVGADDISKVLSSSKCLHKGTEQETLVSEFVGAGLITAPVDHWKVSRRHLNHVFRPQNLDLLQTVVNQNCRELVCRLSHHHDSGKVPVELMEHTMNTSLKTICYLTLGQNVDIDSQDFQGLKKVMFRVPDLFLSRVVKVWLRTDSIYGYLFRKCLKEVKDDWKLFVDSRLEIAKKKYAMNKTITESGNNHENLDPESFQPAIDAYISLHDADPTLTDAELKEEILTMFIAGSDTSACAVASCLLAMAQFPHMQDKLYEEISSVVEPGRDVTMSDLQKLPYLDQVIKETLRLLTVAPFITRRSTEDVQLSECTIPAGATMFVCLAGLHMDPKTFPDPTKFNTERFSLQNDYDLDKRALLAFSAGPRNCIGKSYAYTTMKCMIIHVLLRYRLTTEMDIYKLRRKLSVVMTSVEGYRVSLHDRNSESI